MNTEGILGVALQVILMVVLAYPLGKYIAKVYKGQKNMVGLHGSRSERD